MRTTIAGLDISIVLKTSRRDVFPHDSLISCPYVFCLFAAVSGIVRGVRDSLMICLLVDSSWSYDEVSQLPECKFEVLV